MSETFSNGGSAVVGVGGIDSSATTLPTLYRSGLPSAAVFRIKVESEIMKVTTGGQSTASWTVVRGQEGTTAAAHAEGVAISQPLTAGAISDALAAAGSAGFANPMTTDGDIIFGASSGTATRLAAGTANQVLTMFAGEPAWKTQRTTNLTTEGLYSDGISLSTVGDIAFATDDVLLQRRSTSPSFTAYGPINYLTVPPTFTVTNGGGLGSIDLTNDRPFLRATSAAGPAEALRLAEVTITANTAFTVVALFQQIYAVGTGLSEGGLVIRASAGTVCETFSVQSASGVCNVAAHWWDSYTTKNGSDVNLVLPALIPGVFYLKIVDDGTTNRTFYWSPDGVYWVKVYTHLRTAFLTSPNRVGFFYNTTVSTVNSSGIRLLSWVQS